MLKETGKQLFDIAESQGLNFTLSSKDDEKIENTQEQAKQYKQKMNVLTKVLFFVSFVFLIQILLTFLYINQWTENCEFKQTIAWQLLLYRIYQIAVFGIKYYALSKKRARILTLLTAFDLLIWMYIIACAVVEIKVTQKNYCKYKTHFSVLILIDISIDCLFVLIIAMIQWKFRTIISLYSNFVSPKKETKEITPK